MISMELTEKESKKDTVEAMEHVEPKYPWGLSISLNDESLEKLGWEDREFKRGEEIVLEIKVKVIGFSEQDTMQGEMKNVQLQITEMEVEDGTTEPEKFAKKTYKKR